MSIRNKFISLWLNIKSFNMPQVSMTVRMDSQLKTMFDALCSEFGMSVNTAINVFARAVVQQRRIPFEIKAGDQMTSAERIAAFQNMREWAESGNTPDLSLEEIDDEIKKSRAKQ